MAQTPFLQGVANRHFKGDQERFLHTLLGQLDGMVYRCRDDEHWTMEFLSAGCKKLTGYPPEDLLLNSRISYEDITHPDDRVRVRSHIRAALAAGHGFECEYRLLHADGSVRWVLERGAGIFRDSGGLETIQGFIEDITLWRNNEEALREAEARFRSIFENAVEGIFQTTPEGRYIRVNPALARMYGYESPEDMLGAFKDIGQQLYVNPERRAEFVRRIRETGVVSNFESQVYRRDGDVIWISENAREVRDAQGVPQYYEGTVEDVTTRKDYESHLTHRATHDVLTGLPNRSLFADRLHQAMLFCGREGTRVAVVFVDLDNFKNINDSLGHEAGDAVIQAMGRRLAHCVRESDTVARLGGDEFVLMLQGVQPGDSTVSLAMSRVLEEVGRPLEVGGREAGVTCSIGVAIYPDDGEDPDTLLKHADAAMYQAKQNGRNNFQFFTPAINRRVQDRLDLEYRLRQGLERGEFALHYQPWQELKTGTIVGAEGLLRWKAPQQGMVLPLRFLSVAEETGLIEPIGAWVLETACRQALQWRQQGHAPLILSVNVSPRQFHNPDLTKTVAAIFESTGADPRTIQLEVTESCLAEEPQQSAAVLRSLKELGVQLAIDDFGVGFSSMTHLKDYAVDQIKIDRSFIEHLCTSDKDRTIFTAMLSLARNLGMSVVAEGVETADQYYYLRDSGCEQMQGFYFSLPLAPDDFERLLRG